MILRNLFANSVFSKIFTVLWIASATSRLAKTVRGHKVALIPSLRDSALASIVVIHKENVRIVRHCERLKASWQSKTLESFVDSMELSQNLIPLVIVRLDKIKSWQSIFVDSAESVESLC